MAKVAPAQVCTTSVTVLNLDLASVTAGQATQGFSNLPFKLKCTKEERMTGLALSFKLGFGGPATGAAQGAGSAAAVALSTGPEAQPTHYQQVVLCFPRAVKVEAGDELQGQISLKPAGAGGTDVAYTVSIEYKGVVATADYVLHYHPQPVAWS